MQSKAGKQDSCQQDLSGSKSYHSWKVNILHSSKKINRHSIEYMAAKKSDCAVGQNRL